MNDATGAASQILTKNAGIKLTGTGETDIAKATPTKPNS
jgi:hypothetical protein